MCYSSEGIFHVDLAWSAVRVHQSPLEVSVADVNLANAPASVCGNSEDGSKRVVRKHRAEQLVGVVFDAFAAEETAGDQAGFPA